MLHKVYKTWKWFKLSTFMHAHEKSAKWKFQSGHVEEMNLECMKNEKREREAKQKKQDLCLKFFLCYSRGLLWEHTHNTWESCLSCYHIKRKYN